MTKLLEIPLEEAEARIGAQSEDLGGPELYPKPNLDVPVLPKDPEVIVKREGIHVRIQWVIQYEDKEAEVWQKICPRFLQPGMKSQM